MTAWDSCTVCKQPTASGLLVCYRCAAEIIEKQLSAGVPVRETFHEGGDRVRIRGGEIPCPACGLQMQHTDRWRCPSCGYVEDV